MSLERLTPAASMHLKGPDRQNLGVLVLVTPGEHGPPTIEQVRTHVLARLDRVRRLRQRLQPVPGRIALPVWIDDENFDIRRHVVPLGVPAPVSTEVVEILAAGLVQQRIDLARPPWSLTYIPELDTGQFGFVLRADHVLGSGVTAAGMFAGLLFDLEPGPLTTDPPTWRSAPPPTRPELVGGALRDRVTAGSWLARHVVQVARAGDRRNAVRERLRNLSRAHRVELHSEPHRSALEAPLSGHAVARFAKAPLEPLKDVVHRSDPPAHVNDAVLAAIAGGVRTYYESHGLPPRDLRVKVPVSLLPGPDARFAARKSLMIVDLPAAEPDPFRCLQTIADQTRFGKGEGADAISAVEAVVVRLPGPFARRLSLDLDEHYSNVTVSDIPGPPGPLYCAGGRIDELWPLATLMPQHAARVVVISYAGTLFFGITVDPAVIGDSRPIAEGIERAASELCAPVA
jgi:WS/DGAT/MGAT family acyltransferase